MHYILAIFFGGLASLAFEPYGFWYCALFGLAGWYWVLTQHKLKQRVFISYLFGLSILLPTQHWTGIYVGNLPWLILCFAQALIFTLPALLMKRNHRANQLIFPLSYVAVELLLRTVPFTGFGWSRLSLTQRDSPYDYIYRQIGLAGMALVIATIVIVRNIKHILILAVILASVYFIPDNVIENRTIKVALVQGGVVNLGLNFNNKPKEVFMRHLNQTSTSISPSAVDLIIWPENAVDVDVFRNDDIRIQIEKLSQDLDTPILVGAVTRSSQGLNNQAILFDPKISQTYSKRYLTPFGEYLPLRSFAESVSKYATRIDDFYPGNEFITFNVNGVKFNSLICYELINDIFTKENVNDFVVIQTNNATFGDTAQLDQQLNIARVRAIESGRGVAYVSTTGITSFIDTNGKVTSSLEKFEPGTLIKEITTISGQTNAQKIGFLVESISLGFLVMILGYRRWKMDV